MRRLNNLYNEFKERVRNISISEYYQIENFRFNVIRINEKNFEFHFRCDKMINLELSLNKINLPNEMIEYIKEFVYKKRKGVFTLTYPLDYPFHSPIWSNISEVNVSEVNVNEVKVNEVKVNEVKVNEVKVNEVNVSEYQDIIQIQNHSYKMDWSPSITFEKDILYMIQHLVNL